MTFSITIYLSSIYHKIIGENLFLNIEILFLLLKRFKICGFFVKHCSIQLHGKAQAEPRQDWFTAVYPEWSETSSSSKWQVIYIHYGKGAVPFFLTCYKNRNILSLDTKNSPLYSREKKIMLSTSTILNMEYFYISYMLNIMKNENPFFQINRVSITSSYIIKKPACFTSF